MTIAQKIAELATALGVEINPDGQIADNLNAITLARGGTITNNHNIAEAIKSLAETVNNQNDEPKTDGGFLKEGLYFGAGGSYANGLRVNCFAVFEIENHEAMFDLNAAVGDCVLYSGVDDPIPSSAFSYNTSITVSENYSSTINLINTDFNSGIMLFDKYAIVAFTANLADLPDENEMVHFVHQFESNDNESFYEQVSGVFILSDRDREWFE